MRITFDSLILEPASLAEYIQDFLSFALEIGGIRTIWEK